MAGSQTFATAGVDSALRARLRLAVAETARAGRRWFPTTARIGCPSEHWPPVVDPGLGTTSLDDALRRDLVGAALDARCRDPRIRTLPLLVCLVRTGDLAAQDADQAWLAATLGAVAERGGASIDFAVVTTHGWRLPLTGDQREWRRPPR
ncbi:hypothetical protein [Nocardioides acrostichi]|uniref:Uncharacterized protein n=1 Tax=Nocardioides acrostichi TaxID=2784339 RepID=A0A930Y6H2_9ACTN|nr:hypothetical protein [Nocardioides acrostichi]MBF4160941.1 hypothetical protein [Nocardioides acrostichi]